MTKSRLHNFSSLINQQEALELGIARAKVILELLLNVTLNDYPPLKLHRCLTVLDDLLDEIFRGAEQYGIVLREYGDDLTTAQC